MSKANMASGLLALMLMVCAAGSAADHATARLGYRIVAEYAHDRNAFTQGLVYHRGVLYESTGRYGVSTVRKVELETGRVVAQRALAARYFGEGLTIAGDRLIQLTWREGTGFVYDPETLELINIFRYPTQGWGLAYDGTWLYMSDGSAALYRLDAETFRVVGMLEVRDEHGPVARLNELEFVDGFLYANVWQDDRIARIDPASGKVVAWIHLGGLLKEGVSGAGVLNGIAHDPLTGHLLVTGKLWPKVFAIDILAK